MQLLLFAMLDAQEIRWLKATANELNNLLQKIYGYSFRNVELTKSLPEAQESLGVIVESVEQASHVTQTMLEYILACERYLNPEPPTPPHVPGASARVLDDMEHASGAPTTSPSDLRGEASSAEPAGSSQARRDPVLEPQGRADTESVVDAPVRAKEKPADERERQPTAESSDSALKPPRPPTGQREDEPLDFAGIPIVNPEADKELILVVDDEVHVARLIQMMLSEAGYRVITAQDGFTAVQIYKKVGRAINLVLLDFAMPVMDGSDVFEELRLIDPRVAVVLSSGFPQQAQLSQMLAKGLRGFMPKPYTRDKMLAQIRAALDFGQSAGITPGKGGSDASA